MGAAKYCSEDQVITLDNDTYANRFSPDAALLAVGGTLELVRRVVGGSLQNGFSIVRPPGHHAGTSEAMGFCLFNNVAISARYARTVLGVDRVAIVDWDIHHGNGTQNIFYSDPNVLVFSVHKGGWFYPFTGTAEEVGVGKGTGSTVNVPFSHSNMKDGDYITAFRYVLLPILKEFCPSLILVSAGYDCARGDPIGGMAVSRYGFVKMLEMLKKQHPGTPMACVLEGGYDAESLGWGVADSIRVLLGEEKILGEVEEEEIGYLEDPSSLGLEDILKVMHLQRKYWKNIKQAEHDLDHLSHRILYSGSI
uniref:histone deacetylase n=1 Tax=Arcella intermedia TaxID=1963864 RepID=A0A6B2L794_9EUKA